MKHKSYEMVDKHYRSFYDNNREFVFNMAEQTMYSIIKTKSRGKINFRISLGNDIVYSDVCGTYVLSSPYDVCHIAICNDDLVFFDRNFDKLYSLSLSEEEYQNLLSQ